MPAIAIEGLTEAVDALRQLARKDAKRIVRKGLRRGAVVLREAEREAAPKQTGKLRKAIRVMSSRPQRGSGTIVVSAGVRAKSFADGKFYPIFVVRGHRVRGPSGRRVPPNDFTATAFDRAATNAAETAAGSIEADLITGF